MFNSLNEKYQRFEYFRQNYYQTEKYNYVHKFANTTFGVNDFADWSEEEFKKVNKIKTII